MEQPTAVILAGGEGKRFKPFVTDKTLFPFMGKPVLAYTLEMITQAGIEKVVIACNKENLAWVEKFKTNLHIDTLLLGEPLGMAHAMLKLESKLPQSPIVVMNAVDFVNKFLLRDLLIKAKTADWVITGMKVSEYFPGGYLEIDGDRVISIIEKPPKGSEPSDMASLVFHYFSKPQQFLDLLKSTTSENDDVYEKALDQLMRQEKVTYIEYDGPWSKLKYPHMILDVTNQLLNQIPQKWIHSTAHVSSQAFVGENVWIDEGAVVHEFAVLKGPTYIGKNAVIGNHCLVLNSMIEANCVVGAGTEVSRSYIGPKTWLHHNFVGDSVLEAEINPSYGTCFSNLRLDKKSIKVTLPSGEVDTGRTKLGSIVAKGMFSGVNCSFMPGSVINPDTKILPGEVVKGLK